MFDLVFANINRSVLVNLIPQFKPYMKKSTVLILSGILVEDHHLIQTVLDENELLVEEMRTKGEWEALVVS